MHDVLVGLFLVAVVIAPCVVALTTKVDDMDSK
jgi:hypothetical protein